MKTSRVYWEMTKLVGSGGKASVKTVSKGTLPYGITKVMNDYILTRYNWDRIERVNYYPTPSGSNTFRLYGNHGVVLVDKLTTLHIHVVQEDDDRYDMPFDIALDKALEKAASL
jgi:hypothetical protein